MKNADKTPGFRIMMQLLFLWVVALNIQIAHSQSHDNGLKSSNIKYIDISIQQPDVDDCLGVNVLQTEYAENWIDIYPNPNPGQFILELELQDGNSSLVIQLYDLAGKLVFESAELSNGKSLRKELDVSHLEKGVYILHVTGKEKVGVKQIIIK